MLIPVPREVEWVPIIVGDDPVSWPIEDEIMATLVSSSDAFLVGTASIGTSRHAFEVVIDGAVAHERSRGGRRRLRS